MTVPQRFWNKIERIPFGGCWLWMGVIDRDGYGHMWLDGSFVKVHRYAFENLRGHIPDGLLVLHRCDNPCCVNPEHLFIGTHADNVADKVRKHRHQYGEAHYSTKLTEANVLDIRMATGTHEAIAARFGLSRRAITKIRNRETWKHV